MNAVHVVALVLHLIGLVLGLGGATMTDVLFVTCIRQRRADETLTLVMSTAARVVVVGYSTLVGSGVLLVISGSPTSPRFWAKMIVVAVIGANGLAAHRITLPHLSRRVSEGAGEMSRGFLAQLSVVAAVSLTSWYMALLMGAWRTAPLSFGEWMIGYVVLLGAAITMSLQMTPRLLRTAQPDLEMVLPQLAPAVLQAAAVWPEAQEMAASASPS
ncbi:MAG: hypothetical protein ABIR68_16915 [Ilumatobacteraceae bacterium]